MRSDEWQRIALALRPDAGEAEARYVGPDGTVRASATVPAPSSYDRVRIFCGDYYGNVDVYLDEVTYAPTP